MGLFGGRSIFSLALGLIGAAIGAYFGGPTGAYLGFTLGTLVGGVIGSLIFPEKPPTKSPSQDPFISPAKFNIPPAEEGVPVPYIAGTVKLQGIFFWTGEFNAIPQYTTVTTTVSTGGGKGDLGGGGGGGGGTPQTQQQLTGYLYTVSIAYGLCLGVVDGIRKIYANDKEIYSGTVNRGVADFESITLNDGSVADVYWGKQTQVPSSYLTGKVDINVGYPGVCYILFKNLNLGQTPYVARLSVVLKRCPSISAMTPSASEIGSTGEINPAHLLYDLMTTDSFGAQIEASRIDVDSFSAASVTLDTEGIHLSPYISDTGALEGILEGINQYIDGIIFYDGEKIKLKLLRPDFDENTMITISRKDMIGNPSLVKPTVLTAPTELVFTYLNKENIYKEAQYAVRSNANFFIIGHPVSEGVSLLYCSDLTVVGIIATRYLRKKSVLPASISFEVDRAAYELEPGDPFKVIDLDDPDVDSVIFRIAKIDDGDINSKKDTIRIESVQDTTLHYDSSSVSVTGGSGSGTIPDPVDVATFRIGDLPFDLGGDAVSIGVVAARAQFGIIGFEDFFALTGQTLQSAGKVGSWVSVMTLTQAAPITRQNDIVDGAFVGTIDTTFDNDIVSITQAQALGGKLIALIEDEIIFISEFTLISGSTYRIKSYRGLMDTEIAAHLSGTKMYIVNAVQDIGIISGSLLTHDVAYDVKLLPYNLTKQLALSDATLHSYSTTGLAIRPIVPNNFKAGTASGVFPVYPTHEGISPNYSTGNDIYFSWNPRQRGAGPGHGNYAVYMQSSPIFTYDDSTFEIDIYVASVFKRTISALVTDTEVAYTNANIITDNGSEPAIIEARLFSVGNKSNNSGLRSLIYRQLFVYKI